MMTSKMIFTSLFDLFLTSKSCKKSSFILVGATLKPIHRYGMGKIIGKAFR